ncbi:MAG: glycosyltransferase family 4 protein [Alphaproteobacteria bacterium]|nr:glycosyltransferase family 4 protein [Alphaproteobacteria bacterium]
MVAAGHEVEAYAPENDEGVIKQLADIGVRFRPIPMARAGINPLEDLRTISALRAQFRRFRPDVLLPYTMKPIIYGNIAARLAGVPQRFALVTGLGYLFSQKEASLKSKAVRSISVQLYRTALAGVKHMFVYNEADEADIRKYGLIGPGTSIQRIAGSGVDLELYKRCPLPGETRFLLIARLLADKGIADYVAAARLLRARYPAVRFDLLGPLDPSPVGIRPEQLKAWMDEGVINYLGETRDVKPLLAQSSVFVLPSYYREGIPRTILEAMAMGRPIITTDLPGCRATVDDGENGYLLPARDPHRLAAAMEKFITEPALASKMGERSYQLARERFDVHAVNDVILRAMKLI